MWTNIQKKGFIIYFLEEMFLFRRKTGGIIQFICVSLQNCVKCKQMKRLVLLVVILWCMSSLRGQNYNMSNGTVTISCPQTVH